jgi:membrane fusion protein (multidrug efflux system)
MTTTTTTPVADSMAREPVKTRQPRTWLRLSVVLLLVGLVAAGMIGFHRFKSGILKQVTASIQAEQPTVATAPARLQPWQAILTAVGTLRASNGADLAPEIGGVIDELAFESGQAVAAGTKLVHLRLNDDDAKLQQLQAAAELDAITLKRDQRQLAALGVAQSVVDTDAGNLKVARAQVLAQQAVIEEKTIRAPFAGRLGVRQVDLGQYVAPGTTLVTLQALDPMFIDFYLPQQAIGQVAAGQKITITVDAYPGRDFAGTVASLNAKVDSVSRMLQVRAIVANPHGELLPGMFATVSIASGPPQSLVTIPQAAVAYNPYGSLVYVIRNDPKAGGQAQAIAHQQFVTTGAARGDQVSIIKGVEASDIVVVAGQLKLHNDAGVKIDNSVIAPDDAAPVPQDH